jgi:hypothetical protein
MSPHRSVIGAYFVAGRQALCVKELHFVTKELIVLNTIVYSQLLICPI